MENGAIKPETAGLLGIAPYKRRPEDGTSPLKLVSNLRAGHYFIRLK
jgi:hypothetical protein